MAEYVQRNLEDTLPELEQLERVGLFSREEIKAIVKKRTTLEYRLNRMQNDKADFLKYIEFEKNVLKLVKKRRKKINYFFKVDEIEDVIVVRVQRLYRRLCTLFPSDLSLWLMHIRFLREWRRMGRMSELFTKLLKVNSRVPGLWILAAKTQLDHNHNPDDARRLLLQGIRHHPLSQKLWTEHFRMELLHAYKLNQRMAILKQSNMTLEGEEASLLKGELAALVYKKAIQSIPDDIPFRLSFAKISLDFDFAEEITDEIYKDLQTAHPDKELTWDALARRPLTSLSKDATDTQLWDAEQKCHAIFEEGIKQIGSAAMWKMYIDHMCARLELEGSADISDKRAQHLLAVLEKAASQDFDLTEQTFLKWINTLTNTSQLDAAIAVAEKATTMHSTSADLWEMRLLLEMRRIPNPEVFKFVIKGIQTGLSTLSLCPDRDSHHQHIHALFDSAVSSVKSKNALKIWNIGLEWCVLNDSDRVETLFEAGCKEHRNVALPLKECYLEYAALKGSMKRMRKVYKKLKTEKPLSVDFFKQKVLLERTQPNANVMKLREAYEDALAEYGSDHPELWLDYIKMESNLQQLSSLENIRKLHWRAKRALEGRYVEEFVSGYTLLQLSL